MMAQFGTRRFICCLENLEGELLTFVGEADWREDSEGITVEKIQYWPNDPEMRESVVDYVNSLF